MGIFKPDPSLSPKDKRLLQLIAELLLYQATGKPQSNLARDKKPLTDAQSRELLKLLENLFDRKEFQENIYFAEGVFDDFLSDDKGLREIYLSGRKRRGHSRAMATMHWSDFKVRLGKINGQSWGARSNPMEYEYFLEMERRLFDELRINRRVTNLLMNLVASQKVDMKKIIESPSNSSKGKIRTVFESLITSLKTDSGAPISTNQLAAIMTIVANCSVLFTTRDWSVAGTVSTMAGAFISARNT